MVMIFKNNKARKFLLTNGMVYVFRTKRRKIVGKNWITDGYKRPKIADVVIEEIGPIHHHALYLYVEYSGFNSVEEWLEEIKKFNYGKIPLTGWLYKVKLKCWSYKVILKD